MDFLQPFPLVISPTQLIQPSSEAPVAVTVITREDIEAMGVRHIVDLLRRVPGMTVAYENGSNAFVSYQGLNDGFQKRMQVLVDGRSVYDPFFGGVFWVWCGFFGALCHHSRVGGA
jgi:iron complex outermembrane receptor protein